MAALRIKSKRGRDRQARKERAKQVKKLPKVEDFPEDQQKLIELAYTKLIEHLEFHGNKPGKDQREALKSVIIGYTAQTFGRIQARLAVPLPPGTGKTSSIICFLAAAYELKLLKKINPMITSSKVVQLCDLLNELVKAGIPREEISLLHSYRYDATVDAKDVPPGFAPMPSDGAEPHRTILLCTHQFTKTREDIDYYLRRGKEHSGKRRRLVVWDESLISTELSWIDLRQLKVQLALLHTDIEYPKDKKLAEKLKPLHQYGTDCYLQVSMHREATQKKGERPRVKFPALSPGSRGEFMKMVEERWPELQKLLELSEYELILYDEGSGDPALLHYQVVVPDILDNITILDASSTIRKLMQLDTSIKFPDPLPKIKLSYAGCSFNRISHNTGRSAIIEEFTSHDNGLLKALVEIVENHPDDPVLFFTFKPRDRTGEPNCRQVLEDAIREKGIDLEQKSTVKGKEVPRFNWLTHGNETASNDFGHCKVVVFVGLLHLPKTILAGKILSQKRDLLANLTPEEIAGVEATEQAAALFQGACRGPMRFVEAGQVEAGIVYYTCPDDRIQKVLEPMTLGAVWRDHETEYMRPKTLTEQIAQVVKKFLREKMSSKGKVSTSKIKEYALQGFADVHKDTVTAAFKLLSDDPGCPWWFDKRSMIRMPARA